MNFWISFVMETRTENLHGTESECDSVFASDTESVQTAELPTRKQKSCIDAVVDEGKDDSKRMI